MSDYKNSTKTTTRYVVTKERKPVSVNSQLSLKSELYSLLVLVIVKSAYKNLYMPDSAIPNKFCLLIGAVARF